MVTIRLARYGTKKRPFYRIVAADSRHARDGRFLEILGTYDPCNLSLPAYSNDKKEKGLIQLKTDRAQHWLAKGVTLSPTVKTLFKRLNLLNKKAA